MESIFGDTRLDKRYEQMRELLAQGMNKSLPEMMGSWAELKAAYRFLK